MAAGRLTRAFDRTMSASRLAALLVLGLTPFTVLAATCQPEVLRSEVLKLVKPLIELRIQQQREQFFEDGRWKGESRLTPEVNRRFELLLANRTKVGDEALVFLLSVYLGEHPGEELVCEVTARGRRMLPAVEKQLMCLPLTGLEPLPQFVQGSGVLANVAREKLVKGEKCDRS